MRRLLPLCFVGLAACGAQAVPDRPSGVSPGDVAAFRAAVTNAGCVVSNEGQADRVEEATGFDAAKLRAIALYLGEMGQAVSVEPGGFALTTEACTGD